MHKPESHITFQRLIELMRLDAASAEIEEPPVHVVQRALRLMRQARWPQQQGAERLIAWLTFDSARQPLAAAGVRALDAPARQLVFSAGDYEIDLRVSDVAVEGQVLGPCSGSGRASLEGPVTVEGALDELCQFELPGVPPGSYILRIQLGDQSIEAQLELTGA